MKKKRDPGKIIELLFRISEAAGSKGSLDDLYGVIHQSLDEILDGDRFHLARYDEKTDAVSFPLHADETKMTPGMSLDFKTALSYAGQVIQQKSPLFFDEKAILDRAGEKDCNGLKKDCKTWMGAPLMINDRIKGAILIQGNGSAAACKKEDTDLLTSVSRHIALAVERKESEEKSAKEGRMLEEILKSLPVGVALVQNRIFKWVNSAMPLLFGYESERDFENQSARMIYSNDEDFERGGEKIYKSLITGGTADYEMNLVKKNQTHFPVHVRLNSGDDKNPMAWTIATFTDLSQRRAGEKEKFEKERLQGVLEMAGAVCHEINQPLQAILGYSELLLMGPGSRAIEKREVHSIKSQATRLGRITKKLSGITHYRTVDYPGNTKIIDIWGIGKDMEP
nr:GAF domain-containing protein [Desulfobacula sp.]